MPKAKATPDIMKKINSLKKMLFTKKALTIVLALVLVVSLVTLFYYLFRKPKDSSTASISIDGSTVSVETSDGTNVSISAPGDDQKETFEDGSKVIEYYAMEGCPYCKQFDPIWSDVEGTVKASPSGSSLVMKKWEVSTPDGKKKAMENGINAFPHVQKTEKGETVVFEGNRTPEELKKFCLE
ncbi:thioredoxin domain-containing protein [Tetraselmis virus 1]|uniref:Thioredoxin domain-containing protein n=1 Tax=Tetraselmis virus 1 TaxID=2060617 RepID=A0A2P0VN18_9VIRU|nr:thioredoxin domain-containing protein [Tetraselmis virus 1]AUF82283.1 thioredoxin domain-containing protein [Tetraselmis virus 1]